MKSNCVNCGAPIEDVKCPYCGTIHYDLTVLDMKNPGVIRLKTPMGVIEGWMYVSNCEIGFEDNGYRTGRNILGEVCRVKMDPTVTIQLELNASRPRFITKEDE